MLFRFRPLRGARQRASLFAILAAITAAWTGATTQNAAAHTGDETVVPRTAAERAAATRAILGKTARPASADGLIRIRTPKGQTVSTHGPDFRAYDGSQPGFRPGDPERTPVCSTDNYQHVLYAYPAGPMPADATSEIAEIRSIMRRMNAVLNADSIESGGPAADYKVLCDGSGRIQVDTLAVPVVTMGEIIGAVENLGFRDRRADYTVFLDASNTGWCGIGTYISDQTPGARNPNNSGGGYAVIERGCWNTTAPMHENGHNQGAVQYGSPASTGLGAHCAVDYDVMCYSPDGGDLRQSGTTVECRDRIHFDCGFDDYFDSAPEPGEYLASNWNLGSPENRFIEFSEPTGPEPEPATGAPGEQPDLAEPEESGTGNPDAAPVVAITKRPPRKLRTRKGARMVKFKFRAEGTGISYRCRVDRGRFRDCSSPWRLKLRRGRHTFRVRAIDEARAKGPVARARVTIKRRRR